MSNSWENYRFSASILVLMNNIRNFSIIAHIDHGKSTLADRVLEITNTVEKRKMHDQFLDSMELEQERGITIKMQPVRMTWKPSHSQARNPKPEILNNSETQNLKDKNDHLGFSVSDLEFANSEQEYVLNLIDTPGHIDFSYEVSRALKAVEGSLLLVDATQGVQAQTFTTLDMAREQGLVIIPVLSKVDSPLARVDEIKLELAGLLDIDPDLIIETSGKTGEGVPVLLDAIIERIPPPKTVEGNDPLQALVFDFQYSNHQGVIVYVRLMSGKIEKGDQVVFAVSGEKFNVLEVGTFSPSPKPKNTLEAGEIGYIVTGIKKPGIASAGDTITLLKNPAPALPGYQNPRPVVWASIYPESQDDFDLLKDSLGKLRLSDSSFMYEEESSGALGRGFRSGFLGMLHMEIITERLRREFNLELVVTLPSITYKVKYKNGKEQIVYSPHLFPDDGLISEVLEPWAEVKIISPSIHLGIVMQLLFEHEAETQATENFGERFSVTVLMPLRELMRNFFDKLKSVSSGYASISYEPTDYRVADVTRLDIWVGGEIVPAFTRVVARRRAEAEAEEAVERLHEILPRQQIEMKVQAYVLGRIVSSKTVKAFRKDVLMHGSKLVGGGDISRKKKLLEKQKEGKKKMKEIAKVNIPHEVFLKMMRGKNE